MPREGSGFRASAGWTAVRAGAEAGGRDGGRRRPDETGVRSNAGSDSALVGILPAGEDDGSGESDGAGLGTEGGRAVLSAERSGAGTGAGGTARTLSDDGQGPEKGRLPAAKVTRPETPRIATEKNSFTLSPRWLATGIFSSGPAGRPNALADALDSCRGANVVISEEPIASGASLTEIRISVRSTRRAVSMVGRAASAGAS